MNFLIIRAKIARIHQNTKQTPYFLTSSYRFCITPLPIPVSFSSCRIDAPFFLKSAAKVAQSKHFSKQYRQKESKPPVYVYLFKNIINHL